MIYTSIGCIISRLKMSKPAMDEAAKVTDDIFQQTVKSNKMTKNFKRKSWQNKKMSSKVKQPTYPQVMRKLAPHPIQKILGDVVIKNNEDKEDIKSIAKRCKDGVIAVYVSARWCPPCRLFTPMLLMVYEELMLQNKQLEIVFVSCDSSLQSFNEYFAHMPWLAVPFGDEARLEIIREHYGIASVPTLLLLDPKTGQVFARNGVDIVKADPTGQQFPWREFHKENLKNSGFNKINDLHKKLLTTEEDASTQVDTDPAAPGGSEMELEKEEKESKRSRASSSRRSSHQGRSKGHSRIHI